MRNAPSLREPAAISAQVTTNASRTEDHRRSHGLMRSARAGPIMAAVPTMAQAEGLTDETRKSPKGTDATSHPMAMGRRCLGRARRREQAAKPSAIAMLTRRQVTTDLRIVSLVKRDRTG